MTAPLGAAEALATLLAIIADQPDRPDLRGQDEIDHDAAMEQRAEWRKTVAENPTEGESEFAARRWSA